MKKSLHIARYNGKKTVVLNYDGEYYLLVGRNDRRKKFTRKAIRWARQFVGKPYLLRPLSEYINQTKLQEAA